MRATGPNERLRQAMDAAGYSIEKLAEETDYHPKQVGRWVSEGVVPRRAGAKGEVAKLLDVSEDIWPTVTYPASSSGSADVIQIWPNRAAVPQDVWVSLLTDAETAIDVLVYAGLFLPENPQLQRILADKAVDGIRVRLLLGDPDSEQVAQRGIEEGIDGALAAKIRNVMTFYRPLAQSIGVRLHRTILYTSIYRFNDDMLINSHVYGLPAAHAPTLHLQRHGGGMFDTYEAVFEKIWNQAIPAWDDENERT